MTSSTLTAQMVTEAIRSALDSLFTNDPWLLEDDVNERSISQNELGYLFGVFLVLGVGRNAGTISEFLLSEQTEDGIKTTQRR